jgi:hypothetical protein
VVLSPGMYGDGINLNDLDDLARALRDVILHRFSDHGSSSLVIQANVYLHMILDPSHNMNPSRRLLYQSVSAAAYGSTLSLTGYPLGLSAESQYNRSMV